MKRKFSKDAIQKFFDTHKFLSKFTIDQYFKILAICQSGVDLEALTDLLWLISTEDMQCGQIVDIVNQELFSPAKINDLGI